MQNIVFGNTLRSFGYAVFLRAVALLLEMVVRYLSNLAANERRWLHLRPIATPGDALKISLSPPSFLIRSRDSVNCAPAACIACRRHGGLHRFSSVREIEHENAPRLQYGIQRFHRAFSPPQLVPANLHSRGWDPSHQRLLPEIFSLLCHRNASLLSLAAGDALLLDSAIFAFLKNTTLTTCQQDVLC